VGYWNSMRYAYHDLGQQPEGTEAIVRWRGSAAEVLLLDPVNFSKYRERKRPVFYSGGGSYRRPPAHLSIPEDGRWYVVADLRGYSAGAKATIEVLNPRDSEPAEAHEEPLVALN
jgi:hypothetical protein